MSLFPLNSVAWLLGSLLLFLLVQRWLHREIQAIFLLVTRSPAVTIGLFSLLFFPGVLLHELSHYLMAKLVRVRTGHFSLIPAALPNGTLRMGYVETEQTDLIRDAFIGTAPLISGAVIIGLIGIHKLGFTGLSDLVMQSQWDAFWQALPDVFRQPDFWVWFYLAFTISSTMLPSASDRRAWLPLLVSIAIVLIAAALAGAGPWMIANLGPAFERFLQSLTMVFGLSLVLHGILAVPATMMRAFLSRATGLQVVRS